MPFDQCHWIEDERLAIGELIRQADEAFEAQDRSSCVALIVQIFAALDAPRDGRVLVAPTTRH